MDRTILRLTTALALSSVALSLVPLAAAQEPGPLVGQTIETVTDTGRYVAETAFDAIDGLAPTLVGQMDRAGDALLFVERINEEVVTPFRENVVCIVRDVISRRGIPRTG